MDLYTHQGQCHSFSAKDNFRLPWYKGNKQYIYPIEVLMTLTCPEKSDTQRVEYVKNYFYDIPENIIQDVKNNLCKIVFEFTSESYDITYKYLNYNDFTHKIICNTIQHYGLNKNDVLLACGNLKPFEPAEYNVVSIPNQLFIPLCQPDEFLNKQKLLIKNKRQRPKKLLTFMGKPYRHRGRLSNFIFENDLRKENIVSVNNPFKDISMEQYKDDLNLSDEYLASLPWRYDIELTDEGIPGLASLSTENERQAYLDTYINFISETYFEHTTLNEYNDYELDMTDKCTKPIVTMQPFIIHAQPGALRYLKDIGFKTFDKWWDESYDTEKNHNIRYQKLIDLYYKFSKASHSELAEMMFEMYDILEFNKHYYDEYKDTSVYLSNFYKKLKISFSV